MPWKTEFWTGIFDRILPDLLSWLPRLGAALVLLVGGWIVARLIQALLGSLLHRLGLDRLGEKAGVAKVLQDIGLKSGLSHLLARFVFWLLLLISLLAAADILGMHQVTETLRLLVGYLPQVLAALFILIFGSLVARLVGNAVGAMADRSDVRGGMALGQGVRYVILVFVALLALDQLGIETTILISTATALVASLALALAVSFGWGSRELARNIMAGFHAREEFVVGQTLAVQGHQGRLLAIGAIRVRLETEAGLVSFPNSALTDGEVLLLPEAEEAE